MKKLKIFTIVCCVLVGILLSNISSVFSQTVSESNHINLDAGDIGAAAKTLNLAGTDWEWVRWVTVSIIDNERSFSRMKANSASEILGDPGSNWQAGLFVGGAWTPGGYAKKSGVQFRGVENRGIVPKVYTPKFQGTVEFFGTGGIRKPDYTWDVKAHYEVEDKRIKKIIVLAHVTKGTFRTVGIIGPPGDREIMTHQQEATQRTGDWVWNIIKNFGGTLLDAVNQYLQSQGQGVITRYTYETLFFPAVAGYGTMMLVYYDQVVGIGTSIISFSIFQTNSRVFVEIERANNEISTETLALTLNAIELDNFPDNPLSLQAPDAAARNNKRQSLIENWRTKVFTEIKADNGKIIKDAFGTDVTENLTIEFNF